MQVSRVVRELAWGNDPDADSYQLPCEGCVGYCDLKEREPDLHEIYGIEKCNGEMHIRMRVVWHVTIHFAHCGILTEQGASSYESSEAAEENALAAAAAYCLKAERRDD